MKRAEVPGVRGAEKRTCTICVGGGETVERGSRWRWRIAQWISLFISFVRLCGDDAVVGGESVWNQQSERYDADLDNLISANNVRVKLLRPAGPIRKGDDKVVGGFEQLAEGVVVSRYGS